MRSFLLTVTSIVLLAACDAGLVDTTVSADPAVAGSSASSLLFPLEPGMLWTYTGEVDGLPYDEEVLTLDEITWPGPLDAAFRSIVPRLERHYLDGVLVELSTQWYGIDHGNNVYRLGEESWVREGTRFVEDAGGWRAGQSDALPQLYLPADPEVGQRIVNYLPQGIEVLQIVDLDQIVETPAGTFSHCVEVHENPDDLDHDIILHAPGTGVVLEQAGNGYKVLTGVRRR